ncbi:MAG: serine/threonine protein kinase [Planctomycetes bacterium]|nr:serine/threonine protein kinase [Planctomycetota bacterium]
MTTTLLPRTAADTLDAALADYLLRRETDPALMPSAFADDLPADVRSRFLLEIEQLAEIDRLAAAPPRDLPQRLGGYRILGRLGEGATGTVYEAEQIALGRRVAIKVLHDQVAGHGPTRVRFAREARLAAALAHPAIVPIFDFGEHDGRAFLVMQRVNGQPLHLLLQAHRHREHPQHALARRLLGDPRRLALTFAAIADALVFAHARGVVHRDIKPANLIVDDQGRPTVLDFGLARSADAATPALTQHGDLLGTPLYMAPEQLAGTEVGPHSDIWALGCVLFECLTGRPVAGPFAIDSEGLPAALAAVITECLRREPAARPNARQLADRLREGALERPFLATRWVAPLLRLRRPWLWLLPIVAAGLWLRPAAPAVAVPADVLERLHRVEARLTDLTAPARALAHLPRAE